MGPIFYQMARNTAKETEQGIFENFLLDVLTQSLSIH